MSDKCSFRDALKVQQEENHRRVTQRREQKSLEDDYDKPEPAETKPKEKVTRRKRK